jgi:hypothetical protein
MLVNRKFWSSTETRDKFIKNGQLLCIAIGCALLTCHLANSNTYLHFRFNLFQYVEYGVRETPHKIFQAIFQVHIID